MEDNAEQEKYKKNQKDDTEYMKKEKWLSVSGFKRETEIENWEKKVVYELHQNSHKQTEREEESAVSPTNCGWFVQWELMSSLQHCAWNESVNIFNIWMRLKERERKQRDVCLVCESLIQLATYETPLQLPHQHWPIPLINRSRERSHSQSHDVLKSFRTSSKPTITITIFQQWYIWFPLFSK